jgi:hypothetical protein
MVSELGGYLETGSHGSKVYRYYTNISSMKRARAVVENDNYARVLHTREFDSPAELNGTLMGLYRIVNGIVGTKRERTYGFYGTKLV